MKNKYLLLAFLLTSFQFTFASYWQQKVSYYIEVDQTDSFKFSGYEKIVYTNNSPDNINKLYFHLYFNAFKPNSEMDVRSRTIADPDKRVADRIFKLAPEDQGNQEILEVKINGNPARFIIRETILEVILPQSLAPGKSNTIELKFNTQVPTQIRRAGKKNAEGIDLSMSQWYPKLCEYDRHGWHTPQYIGREFYGIWGSFEVKLKLWKDYIVAAGGILQNPSEVHPVVAQVYGVKSKSNSNNKFTWHYKAENVADFAWSADRDYTVYKQSTTENTDLYFYYQSNEKTKETWPKLGPVIERALQFMNANYGKYPYSQYTFAQGGDGGMEYPLITLINGNLNFESLVALCVHEYNHSWFQGVLGFNESYNYWMDEGFTTYTENEATNYALNKNDKNLQGGSYASYFSLVKSGTEEPLCTHADHYNTNKAYGIAAYAKGGVLLHMIRGMLGEDVYKSVMLKFFDQWKFKHPDWVDFKNCIEKESGWQWDWFFDYWVNTTLTHDIAIKKAMAYKKDSKWIIQVTLNNLGRIPMPAEVKIESGSKTWNYYMPISLSLGNKFENKPDMLLPEWRWVDKDYTFEIALTPDDIKNGKISINIDPNQFNADLNRDNNLLELDLNSLIIKN